MLESPTANVTKVNLLLLTLLIVNTANVTNNHLMLTLLIVNLFQPLVAGNEKCSGKYRFLKFKYSQIIT